MVFAVPMDEKSKEAEISAVLGRSAYFALYDTENGSLEFIDNPGASEPRGAGVAAANVLAAAGVEKVVTNHVGPNAQSALEAAGIEIVSNVGGTLASVIDTHGKK
jgi:predicted Fe-Mo cluster-binding NifX family protein